MKYSNGMIAACLKPTVSILLSLVLVTASNITNASQNHPNYNNYSGVKCMVTSGPNKGKSGAYTNDGWCKGSWGATECKAKNQVSKCKNIGNRVPRKTPLRAPGFLRSN